MENDFRDNKAFMEWIEKYFGGNVYGETKGWELEYTGNIESMYDAYCAGLIYGLEFAAKIAERQRYGVAESLRRYKDELETTG
jgi:hypothetical protein